MRRRWEAEGGEEERGGEGGRHTLATSPIGWPIVDSSQSSMPMTRGSCGWVGCHSMPMSRGSCGWSGCHQRLAKPPATALQRTRKSAPSECYAPGRYPTAPLQQAGLSSARLDHYWATTAGGVGSLWSDSR